MQVQNQRRFRLGAMLVLALLVDLGLLAVWQYSDRRQPPPQAPTTADSQRLAMPEHFFISLADDLPADEDGNEVHRFSDAPRTSLRPFPTGRESAELHSLYRMQGYQDCVIRALNSRTPIFPTAP